MLDKSTISSTNNRIDRSVIQQVKKEEQLSIDVISATLLTAIQNESAHTRLSNPTIDQLIKLSQAEDTDPQTKLELLELAVANRPQGKRLVKLLKQAKEDINRLT